MNKLITYIFPIYNESGNIELLHGTLDSVLKPLKGYDFEILFVNDGSRDDSLKKLHTLQEKDARVTVINFSRNFGHQIAVTAGLDHAQGDAVIIMDSDLQDPPHVSVELIKKWEEGYEVVYAERRSRKDTLFKRASAHVFYRVLAYATEIEIPRNTGDFRLLDRRAVDAVKQFRESNRFLRGLITHIGFRQTGVLFDRDERYAGETSYPLRKMMKLAGDGMFGFSTTPLKIITNVGYFFSFLSILGIFYALYRKLFHPLQTVSGWTLMLIVIFLMGGIQLITLGVVGGYIGRIYTEVQKRPLYVLESVKTNRQKKS